MRDLPTPEDAEEQSVHLNLWIEGMKKPGNMDPNDPQHLPQIQTMAEYIANGLITEKNAIRLMQLKEKKKEDPAKLDHALEQYEGFLKEHGTQGGAGPLAWNPSLRKQAQSLHAAVQSGVRTIDQMGVLQPGELPHANFE